MFNLLFLHLVPVNIQNETYKKITSESTVIKQNNQTALTKKSIDSLVKSNSKSVSLFNIIQTKNTWIIFI